MRHEIFKVTAIFLALLLGGGNSSAAEPGAPAAKSTAQAAQAKPATGGAQVAKQQGKQGSKAKLVDINSASKKELKTLPGIGDAEAARIIAGRPYGSKVWLVSHNILPADKFPAIRDLVIARQKGTPSTAVRP